MSIFKTLFGGPDPKTLKKHCHQLELLPDGLSDLSPYQCSLGGGLLNDPVRDKAGHRMCRGCATEWIQAGLQCTADGNHKHKLRKEELTADGEAGFLSCRCLNWRQQSNRCNFTFIIRDYQDYEKHLVSCPKQLITCTSADCQGILFRQDLAEHLESRCLFVQWLCPHCKVAMLRRDAKAHQGVCQEKPVPCQNPECTNEVKRKVLQLHVSKLCPYTRIKCPKLRCNVRFLRRDLQQHQPACQYRDTECTYCKKSYELADKDKHQSTCIEFPLECKHKGCGQTLPRRLWDTHYTIECDMKEINCPSDDCTQRILQKDKAGHLAVCQNHKLCCQHCKTWIKRKHLDSHFQVCPEFPIQCLNMEKCDITVRRGQRQAHIESECPYTELPCRYRSNHCPLRYLRKDLSYHEKECNYRPMPCGLCNKVMPMITIQAHIEAECPEHTIACIQNCQMTLLRRLMTHHIDTVCTQTIVECEYKEFGCRMTFKRKATEQHQERLIHHHHTLLLKLTYGLRQQNSEILARQDQFNIKLEGLTGTVRGLVTQADRIQSQNRSNLQEIRNTRNLAADAVRSADQLKDTTQKIKNRLDDTNKLVSDTKNDVSSLHKSVKAVSSDLSECNREARRAKQAAQQAGRKIDRLPRPHP